MEKVDLKIERMPVEEKEAFRMMAEAYWRDLMPDSSVCRSQEESDAFFEMTFTLVSAKIRGGHG